ncbi:MFS transporter [Nonomuraea salmonea]|uniref:MFS transporter n=1 Tax=Nonomuraea salmonea TaxID=46181 RepID=UPI002FE8153B
MGWILFGLSLGSMAGILCSGRLTSRFGTRPVIAVGTALLVAALAMLSGGTLLSSVPLVVAGLFTFGMGVGAGEVAVNVDATDIERATGRTTMPMLHGCFSLGTVAGAGAGIAATAARLPVHWHLAAVTVIAVVLMLYAVRAIPAGTGRAAAQDGGPRERPKLWKDAKLLMIGAIVLAMALAEGAANDWLPLLMVDGHGVDAASGSLVYTGFAAAMTIGRFCGTYVLDRFGRTLVVRASAVSGAVGLLLVIFSDSAVLAGAAVLFWGARRVTRLPRRAVGGGRDRARRDRPRQPGRHHRLRGLPRRTARSRLPRGSLGGLRPAMLVVLAFVACAAFLASAVDTRRTTPAAVGGEAS